MKKIVFVLFTVLIFSAASAASVYAASIYGNVIDRETGMEPAGGVVTLLKKSPSGGFMSVAKVKLLAGETEYKFDNLAPGKYKISFWDSQYKTKSSKVIELTKEGSFNADVLMVCRIPQIEIDLSLIFPNGFPTEG